MKLETGHFGGINHLVPELQTDKSGRLDQINFLTVIGDSPNLQYNLMLKITKE
jgi:hypothetical protein